MSRGYITGGKCPEGTCPEGGGVVVVVLSP